MNATFNPVRIGQEYGYLFETMLGDGICFVPEACLRVELSDEISVDDAAYLVTGWPRTNALLNRFACGHRLFPNARAVLCDFGAPTVVGFLSRIGRLTNAPATAV